MSNNSGDGAAGVKGWLLLLSRLLIVWQPLNLAVAGMGAIGAMGVRGPAVAIILVVRTIVIAVGVAAGIALSNRHAGAVSLAKVALALSAATDLFVYTTPYFPNNRAPGDTIFYIAASMAYHCVWLVYLYRSRQVRELF
jgi:hypothetical protein